MSQILSSACADGVCPRRTALVVDDVDDMLDLLEIALDAADFDVLRATTLGEARQLFEERREKVDLLMTDLRVGSENGLDLARQLLAAKPSLRVLTMSGAAWDRRLRARKTDIAFLPKPFSGSELRNKLRSLFAQPSAPLPTQGRSKQPATIASV